VALCSTKQLADKAGVSEKTVKRIKAAVKVDENALEKIRTGQSTATKIVKENKPAKPETPAVVAPDEAPAPDPRDEEIANLNDEINELSSNLQSAVDDIPRCSHVLLAHMLWLASSANTTASPCLAAVVNCSLALRENVTHV
jgi:hypothetical protein